MKSCGQAEHHPTWQHSLVPAGKIRSKFEVSIGATLLIDTRGMNDMRPSLSSCYICTDINRGLLFFTFLDMQVTAIEKIYVVYREL